LTAPAEALSHRDDVRRRGPSRLARSLATVVVAATVALLPGAAMAQADPEATVRATARHISEEALEHYRGERWEEALRGFDKAQTLLRMPTLALLSGRCLERLGRWVEASERYRLALALDIDQKLTPAQQDGQRAAQVEAKVARDRLAPRIPSLAVAVEGATEPGDEVRVDGAPLPREQVSLPRLLDPGRHEIALVRGRQILDRAAIELREGARETVRLRAPDVASPPPHPAPAPPPSPTAAAIQPDDGVHPLQLAGWTAIGVGGASFVVSAITFGAAASSEADLEPLCGRDRQCPPSARDDVASYETLRVASLFSLVGGAVSSAAGVAMLLSVPDAPRGARAQLRVSARGATMVTSF
jgi:hypothetical protein